MLAIIFIMHPHKFFHLKVQVIKLSKLLEVFANAVHQLTARFGEQTEWALKDQGIG